MRRRAAALSAHLRPQPHSRPAAGTTNNLWWAVVDFLVELPQAGFPCSGMYFRARILSGSWGLSPRASKGVGTLNLTFTLTLTTSKVCKRRRKITLVNLDE